MADIQKLKDQIWWAKQELASAQKLRDSFAESRDQAKQMLADDPSNKDLLPVLEECETELAAREAHVAEHAANVASLEAKLPDEFKPTGPKFDPEKHPLLKKTLEKAEPAQPVVFNTGDVVEAYWASDRSWYKAKIMTILGSVSNPKYHVKYVDYDDTQTLDPEHVRPVQAKRKREEAPAPVATPHVVSGPASVNAAAQPAKDAAAEGPPKKKKKAPGTKALERKAANWKEFTSKGIGKKTVKESQFRTGTGIHSRVGFTGSGAGMTESTKRVRHDKKLDERLDLEQQRREEQAERALEPRRLEAPPATDSYVPPRWPSPPRRAHRRY